MNSNKEILTYETKACPNINDTAKEAITLSANTGKKVRFEFNEVNIIVTPDSEPDQVIESYWTAYRAEETRREQEYRNSPEGKAAAAAREMDIATKLARLNVIVDDLEAILAQGTAATIDWLQEYARLVTDVDNDCSADGRYMEVIDKLEEAGYNREDSTFDDKAIKTADVMAKYIVANAIGNIKGGRPPMTLVIDRWANEYKRLANAENNGGGGPKPPALS